MSYARDFGHTRVRARFPQNPALARWVLTQRSKYKKFKNGNGLCGITTDQITLLNNISFEWKMENRKQTH